MPWRPISGAQREIDAFTNEFEEEATFYLDEPVGPNVAEILKAMGYKVRMAADCGMTGRDDADHAALCWRDRIVGPFGRRDSYGSNYLGLPAGVVPQDAVGTRAVARPATRENRGVIRARTFPVSCLPCAGRDAGRVLQP